MSNPNHVAEKRRQRNDSLHAVIGLAVIGVLGGAGVGWLFGNTVLGIGIGGAICVALWSVHYFAVRAGVIVDETITPNLDESAQVRNHIICIDGTWNHPEVPTNVRKLFEYCLPEDAGKRVKQGKAGGGTTQLVKYYSGVGARENTGEAFEFLGKRFSKTVFGGVFGYGVNAIARQAYFDFVKDYRAGDRIYLFGFSRGAAIARILANYICKTYGLPGSVTIGYQKSSLRKHPIVHDLDVEEPAKFGTVQIELLGVWDTVAATGLPGNHIEPFKDLTLPDGVKRVCHPVAIDEVRHTFDPTLFDHDDRVEEVWFPGAHTNVGGGWDEDSGLSDIALRFMINRARDLGVEFCDKASQVNGDIRGAIWTPGRFWLRRMTREIRVQQGAPQDRPKIHRSVFQRIDQQMLGKSGLAYDPENLRSLEYSRGTLEYPP